MYKVTSYVKYTPYLHSVSKFETYLVNITYVLNSPDILAHFKKKQIQPMLFGEDIMFSNFQITTTALKPTKADYNGNAGKFKKISFQVMYTIPYTNAS